MKLTLCATLMKKEDYKDETKIFWAVRFVQLMRVEKKTQLEQQVPSMDRQAGRQTDIGS